MKRGDTPVVVKCDERTRQSLLLVSKKNARSLSSEAKLRINHHLKLYPDFFESFQEIQTSHKVYLRLDEESYLLLLKSKGRSGRTRSSEVSIRLRDHLDKFPQFYNTEMVEVIPNNLESKLHN